VNSRHHWPLNDNGPKSAPQRIACTTLGSVQETPDKPIATYTITFTVMMVRVTSGMVWIKLQKLFWARGS